MIRSARTSITPELIPHTEFHKGRWLLPVNGADWYYFLRTKNSFIIRNKNFLKSVDKPLRELVRFLQKKKIKTTPSCSGHHYSKHNFEEIFDALVEDERKIRNEGLEFKDVENGDLLFLKDPGYELPWSKSDFLKKVQGYQCEGVLGFESKLNEEQRKALLEIDVEGARILEKDAMIFILTDECKKSIASLWKELTKHVKGILDPKKQSVKKYIFSCVRRTGRVQ